MNNRGPRGMQRLEPQSSVQYALGSGADTTSATAVCDGDDDGGTIRVTTGAGPSGSGATVISIKFAKPLSIVPAINLSPLNAAAAADMYVDVTLCYASPAEDGFSIICQGVDGLDPTTEYFFGWQRHAWGLKP